MTGLRLAIMFWVCVVALTLLNCHPAPKEQSWDQENLKKNDNGCPTSIYTVEDGYLIQCPPYENRTHRVP